MLHNLMIIFLILHGVRGFLIDSTTSKYPDVITDTHYIAVIDLLMEERHARHLLEQVVTSLQQKVQSLEQRDISKHAQDISALQLKVNNVVATCSLSQNNFGVLESKFKDMEMNYTLLKDENQKLSQEVATLRQTQSVGSIENLKQQVQKTANKVNQLEYNNMVRNQDIIAISNITRQNELEVRTISQKLTQQITSIEQELLEKTRNDTAIRQESAEALDLKIANLEANQTFLGTQVATIMQKTYPVALTAWNAGGDVTIGSEIKFNEVKTSTGISNLSAINSMGTFAVEVDGVYIIAVTVNSGTKDSGFEIHKNNITLSQVYIQGQVGDNDQSGTGVVSTELQAGDLISVHASAGSRKQGIVHVDEGWSTLSVIRI
ncbi:unnamed protein product [Mytilus coruscus]|uniref:Uncharacterized protein n=1 Tax=Mytilus coruscus TaxID=42192 RepID=A0A6J8ANL1_MYTCO|nr:unnamed protein product [Mytilus coruscus]